MEKTALVAELEHLTMLHQAGALPQAEFEAQTERVLSHLQAYAAAAAPQSQKADPTPSSRRRWIGIVLIGMLVFSGLRAWWYSTQKEEERENTLPPQKAAQQTPPAETAHNEKPTPLQKQAEQNTPGGKAKNVPENSSLGAQSDGGMDSDGLSGWRIGTLGTYAHGDGKSGWGQHHPKGKRKRSFDVSAGPPLIFGSIDKEVIRRVINNNRSRIKYCYEKEFIKYPKIQGQIKVFFQIESDGMVSSSSVKETTMNNERVEECLAQRVKHMRFPAPKGGGIVQILYPFLFKPS